MKAVNAVYISSVFLKYIIENSQSETIEDLCLSLNENEPVPKDFVAGKYLTLHHHLFTSFEIKVCNYGSCKLLFYRQIAS